jgi:heat shock protein 4
MAGIDFGNQTSAIALVRKGSIDVVANEASNRLNPSLVGFGAQERYAGESAQTQYTTNVRNTVSQIKRFLGRKFSEVQNEIKQVPFKVIELPNDEIGIEVSYNGTEQVFTPTKILAILFVQLKKVGESNLNGGRIPDVVISVPPYFSDFQRKAIINAAEIAGLNCVRLMNETTATALIYGFYKIDLSDEKPINVLFIDAGHSATVASVVSFTKSKLKVLSTAFDANTGGRDIDQLLVDHFAADFKARYKIDVFSNAKALLRLRLSCEKLKQVLSSGVPEAPLNIECLMEDKDVSARLTKKDFEEMVSPLVQRIVKVVEQAIADSGVPADQLNGAEIVGASKRIPAIQHSIKEHIQRDLGQTLNDVECVAKGCAIQAAIISPIYKVRDYQVIDWQQFPIEISWNSNEMQDNTAKTLFARNSQFPSVKKLTLKQNDLIEITARYGETPQVPSLSGNKLLTVKVSPLPATANLAPENVRIEIRYRLNGSGIFGLESAELLESYDEVEQPKTPEQKPGEQAPPPADGASPAAPTIKRKVRRHAVNVEIISPGLTKQEIHSAIEEELNMQSADKLAQETAEARNALESYVLGMRNRIADDLEPYGTEPERAAFNALADKHEEWLYEDEGINAKKSELVQKLRDLEKLGNVILNRKKQEETRESNLFELKQTLNHYRNEINETKYEHIEAEEKAKITAECDKIENAVRDLLQRQNSLPKNVDPAFNAEEFLTKKKELEKLANPILSKPKPKPAPTPAPAAEPKPAEQPQQQQDVPMKDAPEPAPAGADPMNVDPSNNVD